MGILERKEREKEQRKSDLINAAEDVFFHKGFFHATMDEIAERAEYSKGTLYTYFKSKEDLYFEIFLRGMEILKSEMRKVIRPIVSGLDNLLAIGKVFISFSNKQVNYRDAFITFESSAFRHEHIDEEKYEAFFTDETPLTIVSNLVVKGIEDGSLRSDIEPALLSATLWSQIMGVVAVVKQKGDIYQQLNISVDDILETHFKICVHGAAKKR